MNTAKHLSLRSVSTTLIALLVLAVSGCGGGSSSSSKTVTPATTQPPKPQKISNAEWTAQANDICENTAQKRADIPFPQEAVIDPSAYDLIVEYVQKNQKVFVDENSQLHQLSAIDSQRANLKRARLLRAFSNLEKAQNKVTKQVANATGFIEYAELADKASVKKMDIASAQLKSRLKKSPLKSCEVSQLLPIRSTPGQGLTITP